MGQNIAMHAFPAARDFFLSKFDFPGPFTITVPEVFFLCWLLLMQVPVWASRMKKVIDVGSHVEFPWNIDRLQTCVLDSESEI